MSVVNFGTPALWGGPKKGGGKKDKGKGKAGAADPPAANGVNSDPEDVFYDANDGAGPSKAPDGAGPSKPPDGAGPSKAPDGAGPSKAPDGAGPSQPSASKKSTTASKLQAIAAANPEDLPEDPENTADAPEDDLTPPVKGPSPELIEADRKLQEARELKANVANLPDGNIALSSMEPLTQMLAKLKVEYARLKVDQARLERERNDISEQLKALLEKSAQDAGRIAALETAKAEVDKQVSELSERNTQLDQTNEGYKFSIETLESKLRVSKSEIDSLKAQKEKLESKIKVLEDRNEELVAKHLAADKTCDDQIKLYKDQAVIDHEEIQELKARIKDFEERIEDFEDTLNKNRLKEEEYIRLIEKLNELTNILLDIVAKMSDNIAKRNALLNEMADFITHNEGKALDLVSSISAGLVSKTKSTDALNQLRNRLHIQVNEQDRWFYTDHPDTTYDDRSPEFGELVNRVKTIVDRPDTDADKAFIMQNRDSFLNLFNI